MEQAIQHQLFYTIRQRMMKTASFFEEGPGYLFYDMGNPENDTHLRGFTIGPGLQEERIVQRLEQLKSDGRQLWNVRIPVEEELKHRDFLMNSGFAVKDEEGSPVMERKMSIDFAGANAVRWWQGSVDKIQGFRQVLSEAFELNDETASKILQAAEPNRLAYIEEAGQVVSCGLLTIDPTTSYAGLYYIGTLKEQRRRGLGKALVAAMTNRALANGAPKVILQASPLGQFVYDRLGYIEVGRNKTYTIDFARIE